jgi:hypothetical protein
MTAPPCSWKSDDMSKWREMQFTFGADESRLQEPTEALAFLPRQRDKQPRPSNIVHTIRYLLRVPRNWKLSSKSNLSPGMTRFKQGSGNWVALHRVVPPPPRRVSLRPYCNSKPTSIHSLYSDLRLMQSNHFYQTEYRHFVVVESKNSTVWAKEKVADSVSTL